MFRVAANEIGAHVELSRNAASSSERVNVHVRADRCEARARRGDTPTSPTASDIDENLPVTGPERPIRNWIPGKPAADAPVQISIRVHDPIVYEGVDWLAPRFMLAGDGRLTRRQVERDRFAARIFRENRNAIFDRELMRTLTDKDAVFGAEFGVVVRARENPQRSVVERGRHSRPAFSLRDDAQVCEAGEALEVSDSATQHPANGRLLEYASIRGDL